MGQMRTDASGPSLAVMDKSVIDADWSDSRVMRRCVDRALGHLSESDWKLIADMAITLTEQVNKANPKARFEVIDALEVLAKVGVFLVGERKK